jgi:YfiH family protein
VSSFTSTPIASSEEEELLVNSLYQLFQASSLAEYKDKLVCGFTGKPLNLGGPALSAEEKDANRAKLFHSLGLNNALWAVPDQTHSANSRLLSESCFTDTDAIILDMPNKIAMVLTADCVPLIFYDPVCHVGAVVHGGWRGTAAGIAPKVVQRLMDEFKVDPKTLQVVIGPSIRGCCYEVSEDVLEALERSLEQVDLESGEQRSSSATKDGILTKRVANKPYVDIVTVHQLQLKALGVTNIETMSPCTRCHPEQLWSHRRGELGRQGAFLMLKV